MNTTVAISAIRSALLIVIILSAPVSANKWECGERSNLPLEGKNYCAAGDFRQAQINLGKVFNKLLIKQQAASGDATVLIESQREFASHRDEQCAAESKRLEDKPYHPMIVAQCKTRLTNLRIDDLKSR